MKKTKATPSTIGYLIGRTARRMQQHLELKFKQAGYPITHEQWVVLNLLWQKDGLSQRTISRMTRKEETSLSRLLTTMVKHHIITRTISPTDRRVKLISLTEKGTALQAQLIQIADTLNKQCLQELNSDDYRIFLHVLEQINHNITS